MWHADEASWEVGVVVEAITDLDARWRVAVADQESEDVVDTLVLGGGVHREVWGKGSTIGIACGLLVWVGSWESIGQDAWTLEHLALVVGPICDVHLGRKLLQVLLGVDLVHEVTEVQLLHGVASGTDLTVNLVAAAAAWDVHGVEDGLEEEGVARRMGRILVVALHRRICKGEDAAGSSKRRRTCEGPCEARRKKRHGVGSEGCTWERDSL